MIRGFSRTVIGWNDTFRSFERNSSSQWRPGLTRLRSRVYKSRGTHTTHAAWGADDLRVKGLGETWEVKGVEGTDMLIHQLSLPSPLSSSLSSNGFSIFVYSTVYSTTPICIRMAVSMELNPITRQEAYSVAIRASDRIDGKAFRDNALELASPTLPQLGSYEHTFPPVVGPSKPYWILTLIDDPCTEAERQQRNLLVFICHP